TFYNGLTLRHRDTIYVAAGGTFMKRRPKECYDLIENMTAHHNDWDTLAQRSESSSSITSSFDTKITALKAEMAKIIKNLIRVLHVKQQVNAVTLNYETCGGPHSFSDCLATDGNTQNVYAAGAYQDTFYNGLTLRHRDTIHVAAGGTFMKRRPKECYDLIENMTAHHNDWDTLAQRSESSSSITSSFDTKITALKAEMEKIIKNLIRVLHVNQQVNAVTPNYETCGGPHSFSDCLATDGNTQNVYAAGAYQGIKETIILRGITSEGTNSSRELTKNMQANITSLTNSNIELKNKFCQFMKMNTASSSGSRTLQGNTITNPKEGLKGITTRRGTAYPGPTIPTTSSSFPVVECETEATKDTVHPANNGSTEDVQPLVVPTESLILNSEPVIFPIIESVASLVSSLRPNQRPSIHPDCKIRSSVTKLLTNERNFFKSSRI
nr:reverse transcriptase domain-containing protein [Tanacetum cinerariifolium]